uniref:Uncharacterized protein n=1 Tax=Meloidogyne enterolobii TaxID=390850 RepID=A0A6V7W6C7_MELEN|nr:unnamed protein product [Meloidogyne enterolobii]
MAAVLQAGINMLRDRLGRHLDTARQIDFSDEAAHREPVEEKK